MVQLMKSSNLMPEPEKKATTTSFRDELPVKLEIEDSLEEEHGPLNKRSKPSQGFQEVRNQIRFIWTRKSYVKQSETVVLQSSQT